MTKLASIQALTEARYDKLLAKQRIAHEQAIERIRQTLRDAGIALGDVRISADEISFPFYGETIRIRVYVSSSRGITFGLPNICTRCGADIDIPQDFLANDIPEMVAISYAHTSQCRKTHKPNLYERLNDNIEQGLDDFDRGRTESAANRLLATIASALVDIADTMASRYPPL
jgi:hypothetical protein